MTDHNATTNDVPSNKAVFIRLLDAINSGDQTLIAKTSGNVLMSGAQVNTHLPMDATGSDALQEVFARLRRAFPDLHIAVQDLIGEGDKVVGRHKVTGTHLGEFMGVPPTGKSITYDEIFIVRFVNGRIAETWGIVDVLSQMRQIGVIHA
jgi:steroid delta-isomerase-like uncharacterized protein